MALLDIAEPQSTSVPAQDDDMMGTVVKQHLEGHRFHTPATEQGWVSHLPRTQGPLLGKVCYTWLDRSMH